MIAEFERLLQSRGTLNNRGFYDPDCPVCGKVGHLGVHRETGACSCWVCGKQKKIPTLARLLGMDEPKVRSLLRKKVQIEIPQRKQVEKAKGTYQEPRGVIPLQTCHAQYLMNRGLNIQELEDTYCVSSINYMGGLFANRIFIPTHFEGERVSWQTRSVMNSVKNKYMSAPKDMESVNHKSIVYGWDWAEAIGKAVVVEGVVDVWKLGLGAVHTFGVEWTLDQLILLSKLKKVFVMYDNETDPRKKQAVDKQANTLAESLSALGADVERVELSGMYHDAGEMPQDEARKLMRHLGF